MGKGVENIAYGRKMTQTNKDIHMKIRIRAIKEFLSGVIVEHKTSETTFLHNG